MFVIKIKNTNTYVFRKPYKAVDLQNADTYRTKSAAKIALKASKSPFGDWTMESLGITNWEQLDIVEVILTEKKS